MKSIAILLASAALILPAGAMAAEQAGTLVFATGEVTVVGANGAERTGGKGVALWEGDTVETGEGRAQIRFTDGAFMTVHPDSELRVNDYQFQGNDEDKVQLSLVRGGLRTITGAIGRSNRENYAIETPVATIGVRGTEYVAQLGNSLTTTVGKGTVSLTNPAGMLLISSHQTGYVGGLNTPPVLNLDPPSLPFPGFDPGFNPPPNDLPPFRFPEDRDSGGDPAVLSDGEGGGGGLGTDSGMVDSPLAQTAGLFITYAGTSAGLDQRDDVTAMFGTRGELTEYVPAQLTMEHPTKGTNSVADVAGNANISIGRWNGGTTGGTFFGNTFAIPGNGGFHYAIGVPATNLPTGATFNYTLTSATAPTFADGLTAPGTFTGDLAIQYGGAGGGNAGFDFNITMPGDTTYNLVSAGGTAAPSIALFNGNLFFAPPLTLPSTGLACANGCTGAVSGFIAGNGGTEVGVSYMIFNGTGGAPGSIEGAAYFSQ